ncbi:unnamed protein product [[Actinomadura] parvosata subsp. kistnae]|uniref:Uncharacterized protein n=1 Tax=[Actinomadura] parvosata subsp. kistnae TaxID=1909395 RepID=A0A1V0A7P3_9ACTN|nr:hypothetical protein [Nonomuraea sp. ATCC 55076]AQZ66199.1 hypothetical protein BKM31_36310 [Nonomuraea sp. ATCC 55076]SPL97708.1 unnamed protein product [Actinomadura parvosata subsp. kistnae]
MRKRVLVWGGAVVAAAALAALIVYFVRVGLDNADKLASVIGLFVAIAGLAVAVYGLRSQPQQPDEAAKPGTSASASASGTRSVAIGGDNSGVISTGDGATNIQMRAEASGQGRIYQAGGDQTINEK